MDKKNIRKWPYLDPELIKEIKIKYITNDIKYSISRLGRKVWEYYLENDFLLKGYKNIIGDSKQIENIVTEKNKGQILMDDDLSVRIDDKLVELEDNCKNKDNQFYNLTWITNELLKRIILDEEFNIEF